jgi:hypothetical protein
MPRRAASRRGLRIVLPDEHAYAEVARLDPEGRGDASAEIVPAPPCGCRRASCASPRRTPAS